MLKIWIPWKFLIQRAARSYNIIDPLTFLARIRKFSQPSEVQEPIELVRAGIAFHTRGLINTKAIQHNLDWIWPYWVERQFNPDSLSFIPRAFSFSHVNLTHRNWSAVGHPDIPLYPIIDPRGLVTPLYDGWSIDFWIIGADGSSLLPSKLDTVKQTYLFEPNLAVKTECSSNDLQLTTVVQLDMDDTLPTVTIDAAASSPKGGHLVAALRPYNPEGIQFIEQLQPLNKDIGWLVNAACPVIFSENPQRRHVSNYHDGDVYHKLTAVTGGSEMECPVGMATGAALFHIPPEKTKEVSVKIPLQTDISYEGLETSSSTSKQRNTADAWSLILDKTPRLTLPDATIQYIFNSAVRTLLLLSSTEIVPGPYTYKRFWFRDACLMLKALLCCGLHERVHAILATFPAKQKHSGYFQSQEGEWDSNGQVLWIFDVYQGMTGDAFPEEWLNALAKAADWIIKKRLTKEKNSPHAGLLPPGFSAEHFGPNDYYYWDDFWSLAGLHSASRLMGLFRSDALQNTYREEANRFEEDIFRSISFIPPNKAQGGIPASPYRRLDAGAVGSLVADYPLHLTPPKDSRIARTIEYLYTNCFHKGAFFQDMIHSGTNIYLTLDIAQSFLRMGDIRYRELLKRSADLASPTGLWPEAIHPITGGGCMGDGQHGWAAAEWIMLIRNLFVREEGQKLIIGSGILPEWIEAGETIRFGPTLSTFGLVSVEFEPAEKKLELALEPTATDILPEQVIIDLPGYITITENAEGSKTILLQEESR